MSTSAGISSRIESLALLPPHSRPALRVICNWQNSAERSFLEELARGRRVSLDIISNLSSHQLALEYNAARLCVYAPVLEPLGLVPLESMACGTAVVGVDEGGVSETIAHEVTGLLTRRDPESFAEAVQSLLSDSSLRIKLGQQGRSYVKEAWQWDSSVEQLERHFLEAAGMPAQEGPTRQKIT